MVISGFENIVIVFFFKLKTAYEMRISDWSSDVCSSDLTLRVATAGGTAAARLAGQNPAIWPSTHSATAPIGRYTSGRRGSSYLPISLWLMPNASRMHRAMPTVASRTISTWKQRRISPDRTSVVQGQLVSVRIDHVGRH